MNFIERGETVLLKQVLRRVQSYPRNHALFVPTAVDWRLDMPCLVLDPDDESPVVGERPVEDGLTRDAVRGVVENAQTRLEDPSVDTLCGALSYYYEHDASPVFEESADEGGSRER
ncbi:DUF7716 domain-containing protein [Natrinema altunense]|uniref:DUF7716 domain-containing protein n=1 Tax=Natrinema altunense TaxID=222984 RepID=A0A482XW87_9EURY|nr:hypothetical protein [Natrinema altunense]RZH67821.1 hypothetical protein ELS17_09810 [Natrinema altunense]